ncbi:hypothetical protein LP085_08580 [Achromobacter sp. MY14]|nr:hypothetical protein [Achromobacter sp. MY14]MCD0496899.1 hypothetical protein [Achromobacter sp. MY14]
MIRRFFHALDRDHAVGAIALVCAVISYGYVQQADEAAALRAGAQQQASK